MLIMNKNETLFNFMEKFFIIMPLLYNPKKNRDLDFVLRKRGDIYTVVNI